jgi:hypothetical protein
MILLLMACELGLEPMCCPPDKEPFPDASHPEPPRPEVDVMDTAAPDKNICIISVDFDSIT